MQCAHVEFALPASIGRHRLKVMSPLCHGQFEGDSRLCRHWLSKHGSHAGVTASARMITRHHKNLKGGRSWNAAFEGYLGKRCGTPDLSAFHAARAKAIISVMKVSTISGKSHDFRQYEFRFHYIFAGTC